MFGFSSKKAVKSDENDHKVAMSALLLNGKKFPLRAFEDWLKKAKLGGKSPSDVSFDEETRVLTCKVGEELIAISLMPAPYPPQDLEGPLATSLLWPGDSDISSVKAHQAHLLIVMAGPNSDPIGRRLILTAVTAAASKSPDVMAVYWPESTQVIHSRIFRDLAKADTSVEAPPVLIWIDIRLYPNRNGSVGAFTVGLAPLGYLEIEIPQIRMAAGELKSWLIDILYYLMANGPILEHGQTIGATPEHQLKITHGPSRFKERGTVIRLQE